MRPIVSNKNSLVNPWSKNVTSDADFDDLGMDRENAILFDASISYLQGIILCTTNVQARAPPPLQLTHVIHTTPPSRTHIHDVWIYFRSLFHTHAHKLLILCMVLALALAGEV